MPKYCIDVGEYKYFDFNGARDWDTYTIKSNHMHSSRNKMWKMRAHEGDDLTERARATRRTEVMLITALVCKMRLSLSRERAGLLPKSSLCSCSDAGGGFIPVHCENLVSGWKKIAHITRVSMNSAFMRNHQETYWQTKKIRWDPRPVPGVVNLFFS